jgi:hypothetical protein
LKVGAIELHGGGSTFRSGEIKNGSTRTTSIILKRKFHQLGSFATLGKEVADFVFGGTPRQTTNVNLGLGGFAGSTLGIWFDWSIFSLALVGFNGSFFHDYLFRKLGRLSRIIGSRRVVTRGRGLVVLFIDNFLLLDRSSLLLINAIRVGTI